MRTPVKGKNRTDVHIDINIGRSVQRVKNEDIVPSGKFLPHTDKIRLFLRGHGADSPAAFHAVDKDAVGDGVHFLDLLSLHIDFSRTAKNIQQASLTDAPGNGLARENQIIQETGKHAGSLGSHFLTQQQMLGNRNVCHDKLHENVKSRCGEGGCQ